MFKHFSRNDDSSRRDHIPMGQTGVGCIADDDQVIAHRLVACVFGRFDSLDLTGSAGFQAVHIRIGTTGRFRLHN